MAKKLETLNSVTTLLLPGQTILGQVLGKKGWTAPPTAFSLRHNWHGWNSFSAWAYAGHCRGGERRKTQRSTLCPPGARLGSCMSSWVTFQAASVPPTLELRLQYQGYLVTFPKFLGHLQQNLDEGFNCTFEHQAMQRTSLPGLTHLRVKEGTGTFFKAPSFGGIWSCRGDSGRWNGGSSPETVIGSLVQQFLRNWNNWERDGLACLASEPFVISWK